MRRPRQLAMRLAPVVLVLALLPGCPTRQARPAGDGPMRIVEAVDGLHGRIEVLDHRGALSLVVDGVFQTTIPPRGIAPGMMLRGGDHVELIPLVRPDAASALIIGLGGGLHARALELHGLEVTAVEIDPEIVRLATTHFGGDLRDRRAYLDGTDRRFDAVVLDAFAGAGLPEPLFTREAFEGARRVLEPGGAFVVHLVGRPGHPAIQAVTRTLEEVFPSVLATRSWAGGPLESIYLLASEDSIDRKRVGRILAEHGREREPIIAIDTAGATVLTDDNHGLDAMARHLAEVHVRRSLAIRRNPPW